MLARCKTIQWQIGCVMVGEGDFRLFNLMRQPVAGAIPDQGKQAGKTFRLHRVDRKALLICPNLARVC